MENMILVLSFVLVFSRLLELHWLQVIYRRLTKENFVKQEFLRHKDMSLTRNSNQVFLLGVGEHDSFLCAICSHYLQFRIKCNMRNAYERKYISQVSAIDVYD